MATYDKNAMRVVCEECGAGRNQACRTLDRTNAGMLRMWGERRETKPHRRRRERGVVFARRRAGRIATP